MLLIPGLGIAAFTFIRFLLFMQIFDWLCRILSPHPVSCLSQILAHEILHSSSCTAFFLEQNSSSRRAAGDKRISNRNKAGRRRSIEPDVCFWCFTTCTAIGMDNKWSAGEIMDCIWKAPLYHTSHAWSEKAVWCMRLHEISHAYATICSRLHRCCSHCHSNTLWWITLLLSVLILLPGNS